MWIELSRRCDTDMGDGEDVELNPCQIDTFVAELVGQEDGRTLYCTACWTPFMPQVYSFSVTDEPSAPAAWWTAKPTRSTTASTPSSSAS